MSLPPAADQPTAHHAPFSATQVAASTLAAISAAIAASFLGVAGTIAGAAVASGLSTVGTALYDRALRQAGERLRASPPRWGRVALTAVAVFALTMIAITFGELLLGHSVADVVHGTPRPSDPAVVQLVDPPRAVDRPRTAVTTAPPTTTTTTTTAPPPSVAPTTTPTDVVPTSSTTVSPVPTSTTTPSPIPTTGG